jgi:hypothetical protein
MTAPLIVIAVIAAVGLGYVVLPMMASVYREYMRPRYIPCPETHRMAAIQLDAKRAALGAAIGRTDVRVEDCSRWPEHEGCGQECLRQL